MKQFILFAFSALFFPFHSHAQDAKPLVQFGKFEGYGLRTATIEELLQDPKMRCLDKKCKITGFDIYGINPGKEYIGPYSSEADTMTESQISYIRSLVRNSKLWINNIHVRYKDGTEKIIGLKDTEYSIYFFNIR